MTISQAYLKLIEAQQERIRSLEEQTDLYQHEIEILREDLSSERTTIETMRGMAWKSEGFQVKNVAERDRLAKELAAALTDNERLQKELDGRAKEEGLYELNKLEGNSTPCQIQLQQAVD